MRTILLAGVLAVLLGSGFPGAQRSAAAAEPQEQDWSKTRRAARQMGRALDRVAEVVSEYGSIHVSPPLLSAPGDGFRFDLNLGATNYYKSAKESLDSATAFFEQTIQSFGAAAAAQMDPAAMAGGLEKVREYGDIQARRRLKQGLLDAALERQLEADLAGVEKLTNQVERLAAIARARSQYASNYVAQEKAPDYPAVSADSVPSATKGLAQRPTDLLPLLSGDRFAGYQGLLGDKASKPTLSNRAALGRAAGDVATEAIFRLLGQPEKAAQLTGRKVMFGVVEVTVNPGWRTGEGYAADVSLLVRYDYRPARPAVIRRLYQDPTVPLEVRRQIAADVGENLDGESANALEVAAPTLQKVTEAIAGKARPALPRRLEYREGEMAREVPLVFAVSPFSDLETMDQGSSLRRQDELSLSLSFALRYYGMAGQAEAFEKFVRSRQSDARSLGAAAPITTYAQGGMVGFQVGPRFQAIGDPTQKRQRPAMKLGRQAFPALLVFGVDPLSVYPKIRLVPDGCGRWEVLEPNVTLTQVPSWRPLGKSGCLESAHSRLKEDEKLLLSVNLREAAAATTNELKGFAKTVSAWEWILKADAFGSETALPLLSAEETIPIEGKPSPTPELPEIGETIPARFRWSGATQIVEFAILGDRLGLVKADEIRAANDGVEVKEAKLVGGALRLKVEVPGPGAVVFRLPVDGAKAHLPRSVVLTSSPIYVEAPAPVAAAAPLPTQPILRTREAGGVDRGGVERVVELLPTASAVQLEVARRVYGEKEEATAAEPAAAAKVHLNVEATENR